jgi:hypothetical protein
MLISDTNMVPDLKEKINIDGEKLKKSYEAFCNLLSK